ncbi:hypothetical protein CEE44_05200 [Candidatus Woesearchaeota archaeon B3_Woes]|nr:MAG: hypothetical protein CEE44_05200 [Candidatus Woesearchaeota archaeon B3_Woes]
MAQQKQKYFIKAEKILKYLITDDDETDTLITCKSSEIDLVTSDYDVYQALASIKEYDNFNLNKLKKLFEVVEIVSYAQNMKKGKPILKDEDVKILRKSVLGEKENDK